ncbi:MAG: NTP transferase domain-containing protein [Candidatus Krumholzibacteriota bacterium]|nr:NTP transferase domain-containing protein [Candidatus Krumholzibacteriota bacterium]
MQAVILAGGKGRRLRPYTTILPKPMMPIGDQPILGLIINKLAQSGITKIVLTVGYLAGIIEAYFGNGEKYGVEIEYFVEDEPLGTAGCLSLIDDLEEEFVVTNGDILSDLDYNDLLECHRKGGKKVTICSYRKEVPISLGVLELEDSKVVDYVEKPTYEFNVSTGIYVLNRSVVEYIPRKQHFDFPSLIKKLIEKKEPINVYQFKGEWYDIGREEDYKVVLEKFFDE